jgi:hypothetical protein
MPRLVIDMVARFAQVIDAVSSVNRSVGTMAKQIDGRLGAAAGAVKGLVVAFGLFKAVRFGQELINDAEQLGALSKRTKIAVEDLAGLKFAAEQSETSLESLATGVQRLQRSISEAGTGDKEKQRLFNALGLKEAAAGTQDVMDTLLQLADIFPRLKPNDQTRVAMELMGRSAAELLGAFEKGRAGLEALINRGKELNPNIAENSRRADEFNDKMGEMSTALRSALLPAALAATEPLKRMADEILRATTHGDKLRITAGRLLQLPWDLLFPEPTQIEAREARIRELTNEIARLESQLNSTGAAFSRADIDQALNRAKLREAQLQLFQLQAQRLKNVPDIHSVDENRLRVQLFQVEDLKLPGKDVAKQQLQSQLNEQERVIKREKDLFQSRNDFLKQALTEYDVTLDQFTNEQETSLNRFVEVQRTALQKQLELIKKFKAENTNPDDQLFADDQINKVKAELEELESSGSRAAAKNALDGRQARKAQAQEIREINAALLELQGNSVDAIRIRVELEQEPLRRKFQDQPGVLSTLDSSRDLQIARGEIGALEEQASLIRERLAAEEERVKVAQQLGALSEIEGLQRVSVSRQAAVRDLLGIANGLEDIAQRSGDPRLIQGAERFRLELQKLHAEADLLRDKFESVFVDGFGNTLERVMDGQIRTLREFINSFTNDITKAINKIAANEIASQLFGRQGAAGGIPEFFSSLFGRTPPVTGTTPVGSGVDFEGVTGGGAGQAAAAQAATASATALNTTAASAVQLNGAFVLTSTQVQSAVLPALLELTFAANAAATALASAATANAGKSAIQFMPFEGFAKGGAFQRFANGDVFNTPTFFKFANGGQMRSGVMGEAGPEAILPLRRGRDGKLGVAAGGGGNVTNHFVLHAPADARTQQQIARAAAMGAARAMRRDA